MDFVNWDRDRIMIITLNLIVIISNLQNLRMYPWKLIIAYLFICTVAISSKNSNSSEVNKSLLKALENMEIANSINVFIFFVFNIFTLLTQKILTSRGLVAQLHSVYISLVIFYSRLQLASK